MSILTMCPGPEWFEPRDLIDDDDQDDQPAMPPEALSVSLGAVWWTAALDTTEDD